VLDTFQEDRSGYVFAVNPSGERFDGLVTKQGEEVNSDWDMIFVTIVLHMLQPNLGLTQWMLLDAPIIPHKFLKLKLTQTGFNLAAFLPCFSML